MSSDTTEAATDHERTDEDGAGPLTIALPDGSENVSDAILSHRRMLSEPRAHGLATDDDVEHLSEGLETLSQQVQDLTDERDEADASVEELRTALAQQQAQIRELRATVDSLTEILGTSTDWETAEATVPTDETEQS